MSAVALAIIAGATKSLATQPDLPRPIELVRPVFLFPSSWVSIPGGRGVQRSNLPQDRVQLQLPAVDHKILVLDACLVYAGARRGAGRSLEEEGVDIDRPEEDAPESASVRYRIAVGPIAGPKMLRL